MLLTAFDLESHLIKPGMMTPRLVCASRAWRMSSGEMDCSLLPRDQAISTLSWDIQSSDIILVGHNVAFDLGVLVAEQPDLLQSVFDAYEANRIKDTQVRAKLIDIAEGNLKNQYDEEKDKWVKTSHSLQACARKYLGRHLEKEDTWRLDYWRLDGRPLNTWPNDAREYALRDATTTLEVYEAQERYTQRLFNDDRLPDEDNQARAAWALHLMSIWGVRTDPVATKNLKQELEKARDEAMVKLRAAGLIHLTGSKKNPKEAKNLEAIRGKVAEGFKKTGEQPPKTEKDGIATDEEALKKSGDPDLLVLAEAMSGMKLLNTYVPILEAGNTAPICASYNVLVESGRTSCQRPNMQNPPRKGGVRECYVPRPGFLFCSVDYDTLELRSLAQVCLWLIGESQLAEAFKRGEDPHLNLAAALLDISVEEAIKRKKAGDPVIKERRQFAKVANFGYPGGLGAHTFIEYAAAQGVFVDLEQSEFIRATWFKTWPEIKRYFDYISRQIGIIGEGVVTQLGSGRVRGGVSFTAAANTFFQGLAADGAKKALWAAAKECYLDKKSTLYGSRPVMFIHDEIIAEVPVAKAAAASERLATVMREAMQSVIPDVPITCSPALMRRWYKGAETVRNENGVLIPWEPKAA